MSRRVAVFGAVLGVHGTLLAAALLTPPAITSSQLSSTAFVMVLEPETTTAETPAAPVPPVPVPQIQPSVPPPVAVNDAPAASAPPAAPAPAAAPAPVVTPPQINPAYGAAPPIVYPPLSRRLGETGTVLLHLHVLADGSIGDVAVLRSSGYPRLDKAARDAALRWHLTPARRGDEPIALWYQWPIRFELD